MTPSNHNSMLESPRTSGRNSSSTKSNYWSTMRALSNDDSKRFRPFSTGSNSASPVHDEMTENNNTSEVQHEDNYSKDMWSVGQNLVTAKVEPCGDTNNVNGNNPVHKSSGEKSLMESNQINGKCPVSDNLYINPSTDINPDHIDQKDSPLDLSEEDAPMLEDNNPSENDPLYFEDKPQDNVDNYDDDSVSENNASQASNAIKESVKLEPAINGASESWTLPADRNACTLEEIRRGQVINKTASNECPVIGCGKKINELRIEPSPGTIASGLRTHVLFVHYANRKINKKRKLCWTASKRRNQASPKKSVGNISSQSPPATSKLVCENEHSSASTNMHSSSLNLLRKNMSVPHPYTTSKLTSLLDKRVKQAPIDKTQPALLSSIQSLIQASSNSKSSPKQKTQETDVQQVNNFNPTTSSLFSILAGLTQQQNVNPAVSSKPKNVKSSHNTSTINISQCSKNSSYNNLPANSSLLSLLNEKISGNVANSLQTQLKKNLTMESRKKNSNQLNQNCSSGYTSYVPPMTATNDPNFNSSSSIFSLCSGVNTDNRSTYDSKSITLDSFVESIASKTGSNLGPVGVAEAKKIIERFTTSLICSSQTIADHYLAPFAGDIPQQKAEISTSDLMLAYKMMHKSVGQPL